MIDIEPNADPKADLIHQQPAQKNDEQHASEDQLFQLAFKLSEEELGTFEEVLDVVQKCNGNEMKARMTLLKV